MIEVRLKVPLEKDEYAALLRVATEEFRNPVDQLRFFLRQELERRGLLEQKTKGSNDQNRIPSTGHQESPKQG